MEKLRQVRREQGWLAAAGCAVAGSYAEMKEVLVMPNLWRVVIFSLSTFFVAKQVALDAVW